MLHLTRLGYTYLSLKNATWDESTNIFTDIFRESIARINPEADPDEIARAAQEISIMLDNEDLGRGFFERMTRTTGLKLVDFEDFDNNSFHVVTELAYRNGDEEFRPDITLLINGLPLVFMEVKKPNNRDGILAERTRINRRLRNTILHPYHRDERGALRKFNFIVSNPPFKLDFSDYRDELDTPANRERFFAGIPKVPNKDKDKMAIYLLFIQHIIHTLAKDGKAAIVVPTGFITAQSGIERKIREHLVAKQMLAGVVSMPSNIFATTGTNVSILFPSSTPGKPSRISPSSSLTRKSPPKTTPSAPGSISM
ncbi:MAG: N-6 DNA methylase [Akkermansiaceae bacterium]|nr:N-6 DNA methylase [Akkermansiaceae bacterium]